MESFNTESITRQINKLSEAARERMNNTHFDIAGAMGCAEINFMTPEEREQLHQLKMMLPSSAEEREAARERIAQRIASRGRGRSK